MHDLPIAPYLSIFDKTPFPLALAENIWDNQSVKALQAFLKRKEKKMDKMTSSRVVCELRQTTMILALAAAMLAGNALAIVRTTAGVIDPAFNAKQTFKNCACLSHKDKGMVGVVPTFQVAAKKLAGKKDALKLQSKVICKFHLFAPGGKIKSKTFSLTLDINDHTASGKTTVDLTPIGLGKEEFTMNVLSDGTFFLKSGNIEMMAGVVGGNLTAKQYNFIGDDLLDSLPVFKNAQFITRAFPDGMKGSVADGKKIVFPTGNSLKLIRVKLTLPSGEKVNDYLLAGDVNNPNPSQLKVNYSTSSGKYKTSFKLYSIETQANGKKTLRKYSVTGYGFIFMLKDSTLQNGYAPVGCSKLGTMADGTKWTVKTELLTNLRQPIN